MTFADQRQCHIMIGTGLLEQMPALIRRHDSSFLADCSKMLLLCDAGAAEHYAARLCQACADAQLAYQLYPVPAGETSKAFPFLQALCEQILADGIDRQAVVVTLGGGVMGDLGGFCASILLRGLRLIHLPTTLLAQVDSAIGGKTAINAPSGKNLIGTFYQPRYVFCDTRLLETLPLRQRTAGYGEIIKYACIRDAAFFDWLESHAETLLHKPDSDAAQQAIATCVQHKAAIVLADEQEQGGRALLNLGHSFAHALEAIHAYRETLLHGEAVMIGLVLAARLSLRLGYASDAETRIRNHLVKLNVFPTPDSLRSIAGKTLLNHMRIDKKNRQNQLNLVLMRSIGDAFLYQDCPPQQIIDVWDHFKKDLL